MRFIESFAADVSHEFKNPLTSIRAAAEMLRDVEDPGERARFAGVVEREIARLERLLSTVREVTLVDSEIEEPETETVDLAGLLKGLAAAPRYRERGIEIEFSHPDWSRGARAPATGSLRSSRTSSITPWDSLRTGENPGRAGEAEEDRWCGSRIRARRPREHRDGFSIGSSPIARTTGGRESTPASGSPS
jgi:signal transduction histidine kinase